MERVEDVVRFLARNHTRGMSQIRLLKLFYLAELKHIARTGRRLTGADFFHYKNGPFSKKVINTAHELVGSELELQERVFRDGHEGLFFIPAKVRSPRVSREAAQTLDLIVKEYGRLSTEAIKDAAYETLPFAHSRMKEDIDFARWKRFAETFFERPEIRARVAGYRKQRLSPLLTGRARLPGDS